MKANEAPEKIYIPTILAANTVRYKEEGSIEYTRTDAFIEKACDWLKKNGCGYWLDDSALLNRDLIEEFRKYMEE